MYRFGEQKRKGAEVEKLLDAWFGRTYDFEVRPATPEQQRQGIDRVFIGKDGKSVTVEYKADWTAHTSGNAFIEVGVSDGPGWALNSQADLILYYLPQRREGYWLTPRHLRRMLTERWQGYPRKIVHNPRYIVTGVLVPLDELSARIQIKEEA